MSSQYLLPELSQSKKKKSKMSKNTCKYLSAVVSTIVESKLNHIIIGAAGVGKTRLLNRIYNELNEKTNNKNVITKLIGQDVEILRQKIIINTMTNKKSSGIDKNQQVVSIDDIINANILMIDDFSMMNVQLFEWINKSLQEKHNNRLPFGGIRLIMTGDPYTLPPVQGSPCFKSPIWSNFEFVIQEYKPTFRHRGYSQWFSMLKRIRRGQATDDDLVNINQIHWTYQDLEKQLKIEDKTYHENNNIIQNRQHLFGHKNNVKKFNLKKFESIKNDKHTFEAIDQITPLVPSTIEEIKKKLDTIIDEKIIVKVGAPIIITHDQNDILNGTTGKISKIHQTFILINVGKKKEYQLFRCLFKNIITTKNGIKVLAKRYQFPVQLNFAMTIYKSIGLEFESPVIYTDDFWLAGQFYTALSRGTVPDNIILCSTNGKFEHKFINNYSHHGDYFYEKIIKK